MAVNAREPKLALETPEYAVRSKVPAHGPTAMFATWTPYFRLPYLLLREDLWYGEPVRILAQRTENTEIEWPGQTSMNRRECFRLLLDAGADAGGK
jgi:hypothetical protein